MSKPKDFWSRRKAAVAEQEAAEDRSRAEAEAAEQQLRLEEKTDAEILEELGLKDPDEMQAGDDFAAFLKAAVPDRIRRRALRRLWLSNPVLANLDKLVEYGEDYTDAATVVENMQSAIQLGRGALQRAEAHLGAVGGEDAAPAGGAGTGPDRQSVRKPVETDRFQDETAAPGSCDTMTEETPPDEPEHPHVGGVGGGTADPRPAHQPDGEDDSLPPRPRRMQFHFLD